MGAETELGGTGWMIDHKVTPQSSACGLVPWRRLLYEKGVKRRMPQAVPSA